MSDYDANDDLAKSVRLGLATVKERMANGGAAWPREQEDIGVRFPGVLSAMGWELPATLEREQWLACGRVLDQIDGAVQWWVGDWWRFGAERKEYGTGPETAEAAGFAYQTCADAGWVADKIEFSRRRENLSFSHHKEVAGLPSSEQDDWLDRAEREGWSANELRAELRRRRNRYRLVNGPEGSCCGFEELHRLVHESVQFGTIYVDPPWLYDNQATRAATNNHYDGLTVEQLCDPDLMPVAKLAADNAHLHLWTTNGFLFECPRILAAWGFEFKSTFIWVKPDIGLGNYWRNAHEILLTAVRGDAEHFDNHSLRSWVECARGRHSDKPDQVRDFIAGASPTPRLELFGRAEHDGWLTWGDQIQRTLFSKRLELLA